MAEDRLGFEARRIRVPHITVPPIALEVIQNARRQYRHLRQELTRLAEKLGDPRLTTEDHFAVVRRWEGRWQQLVESSVGANKMGLGLSSHQALIHGAEFITGLQAERYVGVVVSALRLAGDARHYYRPLLFRPIHFSVRNYIRTGTVAWLARDFFEISPPSAHRQLASIGSSTGVWRAALATLRQVAMEDAGLIKRAKSVTGLKCAFSGEARRIRRTPESRRNRCSTEVDSPSQLRTRAPHQTSHHLTTSSTRTSSTPLGSRVSRRCVSIGGPLEGESSIPAKARLR
jgi:hypothetical protein